MRGWDIQQGDCLGLLRALPENSIDAIVTDPPYGLSPDGRCRTWDDIEDGKARGGFMGKGWDAAVPGVTWARECLRVCKPGAHIVAFGGQRTIHRLICGLEDAGWEIRDLGAWQQWQGFPKSLSVGKAIDAHHGAEREDTGIVSSVTGSRNGKWSAGAGLPMQAKTTNTITAPATDDARTWEGYGTALKPCLEPWTLARKPLDGTVAENVLKWGTGALNIDGCRYGYGDPAWPGPNDKHAGYTSGCGGAEFSVGVEKRANQEFRSSPWEMPTLGRWPANVYACPKASRGEREAGCGHLKGKTRAETVEREPGSAGASHPRAGAGRERTYNPGAEFHDGPGSPRRGCSPDYIYKPSPVRNYHPTVKPVALMGWLCRLVGGQPGSLILDPFAGSGTTGIAALREGFRFLGFELEPDYIEIAEARINGDAPLFNRRGDPNTSRASR